MHAVFLSGCSELKEVQTSHFPEFQARLIEPRYSAISLLCLKNFSNFYKQDQMLWLRGTGNNFGVHAPARMYVVGETPLLCTVFSKCPQLHLEHLCSAHASEISHTHTNTFKLSLKAYSVLWNTFCSVSLRTCCNFARILRTVRMVIYFIKRGIDLTLYKSQNQHLVIQSFVVFIIGCSIWKSLISTNGVV